MAPLSRQVLVVPPKMYHNNFFEKPNFKLRSNLELKNEVHEGVVLDHDFFGSRP